MIEKNMIVILVVLDWGKPLLSIKIPNATKEKDLMTWEENIRKINTIKTLKTNNKHKKKISNIYGRVSIPTIQRPLKSIRKR